MKFVDNYEIYDKITMTYDDRTIDISYLKDEIDGDIAECFYLSKLYRGAIDGEVCVITFIDVDGKSKKFKVLELNEEKFEGVNDGPSNIANSDVKISGAFYLNDKLCVAKFYNGYLEFTDDFIAVLESVD